MILVSYNLNGIRSATGKGLLPWVATQAPDVLCFQEVRAPAEGWNWAPFAELGYAHVNSHLAVKPGYSGVATLSRQAPLRVVAGTGDPAYDAEGRVLRVDFAAFTVVNVYIPSGARGTRHPFKMTWLAHFAEYLHQVAAEVPALVICGDFNICHQPIDLHDPIGNKNNCGFLPDERAWLTELLGAGFIDTFRHFNPDARDTYTWWSNRPGVRDRNKGWRLDYLLTSENLRTRLRRGAVLADVRHSDHCPVLLEL